MNLDEVMGSSREKQLIFNYLFMIISFDIGLIEQVRFGYSLSPGLDDYSEMMGYGIWDRSSFFFFLTWTALAVVFVLVGIQFWRRGTAQRVLVPQRLFGGELSFGAKAVGLGMSLYKLPEPLALTVSTGLWVTGSQKVPAPWCSMIFMKN